jgi:hypothetical protein
MRVRVIVAGYSVEQLRRKAHLANGGTIANYDRSHYNQINDKIELGENNNDKCTTNNN